MGKNSFLGGIIKKSIVVLVLISLAYFTYNFYISITYPLKHTELIKKYSQKNKIDPYLLTAIIKEESGFDAGVVSEKGAIGLMQVMPKTAEWISKKQGYVYKEEDLKKPETSIKFGSWYFNYLLRKYRSTKLALAAYNGGVTNVDRWIEEKGARKVSEDTPFSETDDFVDDVVNTSKVYKRLYPKEFK
jgi:soluble lytic murein transglycosylase